LRSPKCRQPSTCDDSTPGLGHLNTEHVACCRRAQPQGDVISRRTKAEPGVQSRASRSVRAIRVARRDSAGPIAASTRNRTRCDVRQGEDHELVGINWPSCGGILLDRYKLLSYAPSTVHRFSKDIFFEQGQAPNGNASNQTARSRGTCSRDGAGSALAEQATRGRPILAPSG
jgi:hypothetical protein